MELFSIQPTWIYDKLLDGKTFQATPSHCDPASEDYEQSWAGAYAWLVGEMKKRCKVQPPASVTFPIWAWHWWAGPIKRKPDLRFESTRNFARKEPCVLLTLDVPDGEVLLSEYHAWHHVLNAWYLAVEADADAFEARCAAVGCDPYRDKPLPHAHLQAEMEQTWTRIFDLESVPTVLGYDRSESYVQATFWELRPEMVREAVWFERKGASRRLPLPAYRAAA